jgi:hypothetical protein
MHETLEIQELQRRIVVDILHQRKTQLHLKKTFNNLWLAYKGYQNSAENALGITKRVDMK